MKVSVEYSGTYSKNIFVEYFSNTVFDKSFRRILSSITFQKVWMRDQQLKFDMEGNTFCIIRPILNYVHVRF